MASLTPLFDVTEVTGRLGRDLTSVEAMRVPYLIGDATTQIVRYCRKDFQYHANDVLEIKGDGSTIKLPYRPVVSVSDVIAISGRDDIPDIPVSWWVFDGIDEVSIAESSASGVINLPEAWYDYGAFPGTFQVTYSHGYVTVPDDVIMVGANAVIAVLMSPTMAAGVIGETVGPYSYRMERSGGGIQVAISEDEMAFLQDYRDKTSSVKLEAS